MKIALCFIISYEEELNKEKIWRDWIEPNKDIINIYIHYKDYSNIKSVWIKEHVIPEFYICDTSYYHVIPAYMSLLSYARYHNSKNMWFCMLTDSCVPIIHPLKFRELFFNNYKYSIISWRKPWWNILYNKRANLILLKENLRLGNDPWFILTKEDVLNCIKFSSIHNKLYRIICNGGLANESLFAIILYINNSLHKAKNYITHATDWSRMSSSTSPHIFKSGNKEDLEFIDNHLKKNEYTIFLRKVSSEFPDSILLNYIYNNSYNNKINYYYSNNIKISLLVLLIVIVLRIVPLNISIWYHNLNK